MNAPEKNFQQIQSNDKLGPVFDIVRGAVEAADCDLAQATELAATEVLSSPALKSAYGDPLIKFALQWMAHTVIRKMNDQRFVKAVVATQQERAVKLSEAAQKNCELAHDKHTLLLMDYRLSNIRLGDYTRIMLEDQCVSIECLSRSYKAKAYWLRLVQAALPDYETHVRLVID